MKLQLQNASRSLLLLLQGVAFLSEARAQECQLNTVTYDSSPAQVEAYFVNENKTVLTFVGYSGKGYEDEKRMLLIAEGILTIHEPSSTIVNIGGTAAGIGAIYELAVEKGFATTGILSSQARKEQVMLSPCVATVFYIEGERWGGWDNDAGELSPTSRAMVAVSDKIVGIGGGLIARDELMVASCLGKWRRFYSAEMNHEKAREKGIEAEKLGGAVTGKVLRNPNGYCPGNEL